MSDDVLVAWVKPLVSGKFRAGFIAQPTINTREPATRECSTYQEGKRWIEEQADIFGVGIRWWGVQPSQ